jgi:hypothetical protein
VGFPQVRNRLHGREPPLEFKLRAIRSQSAITPSTSDALVDVDSPTDPRRSTSFGLSRRFPVDRDLAKIVLRAIHSGERELANLVPFIKEHCDKDDYERISIAIASVLHDLNVKICQPIYEEHPEVAREIEDRVERFGRVF